MQSPQAAGGFRTISGGSWRDIGWVVDYKSGTAADRCAHSSWKKWQGQHRVWLQCENYFPTGTKPEKVRNKKLIQENHDPYMFIVLVHLKQLCLIKKFMALRKL